jgi:hypothetical protein
MTELSPAAQAVLDAWIENTNYAPIDNEPFALAAALRKAAGYLFPNDTAKQCYDRLLAIATELEGK